MTKLEKDISCVDLETETSNTLPLQAPQRRLKGIIRVAEGARTLFIAVGALAAITGIKTDSGSHNCSGCSVCAPPPIARKNKDDEDDRDDDADDED